MTIPRRKRAKSKAKPIKRKPIKRKLSPKHRKAIAKGLRRYWKRQREEGTEVPRGFKTNKREIEPMLQRALRIIMRDHGVDGDIRREINADNSVDWELRFAIPRATSVDDLTTDLAQTLKGVPNCWIGIGVRFASGAMTNEDRKTYDRFRSMLQVHAHYQRMTNKKIQTNVLGIQKIVSTMRKRKRRKPEQVFVRVHWNLEGRKPE